MESCTIEGMVEGKRRRERPLTSWASDIVKLVGGSLAGAAWGVHYIYFGYVDVPSGRVSIFHILF